jgi:hypothetical protein
MNDLGIDGQELSRVMDEAVRLAKGYWSAVDERAAYPTTSGSRTVDVSSRTWPEHGRGADVLRDFDLIAAHTRPSNELSRHFRALKLWMSLQFHGQQAFRAAITRGREVKSAKRCLQDGRANLVPGEGIEPTLLSKLDFESNAPRILYTNQ